MPEELRQIGEVAEATGFSHRTIRHYEEVGLVRPVRTTGGFRLYGEAEVARLRLIRRMRPLGFTLADTAELLELLEALEQVSAAGADDPAQLAFLLKRLESFEEQIMACAERLREQMLTARELSAELRHIWTSRAAGAAR
jgi:DNA-binding transcriptional MerR regulator